MSLQCDPQGVGTKMSPCPRVFGATPLDLWLRNGPPQGVPAPTYPARRVTDPTDPYRWVTAPTDPYRRVPHPAFIALYRWVEDPARDPRFIATGRAATAAMTCGQIIVRTSTPCGSH